MDELARRQRGYLTREQLHVLGVSPTTLRRQVDDGRLLRVGRRTFRVPALAPTWEGRILASTLDIGAVASHLTGVELQGLREPGRRIHLSVERARNGSSLPREIDGVPIVVHGVSSLPRDDRLLVRGIPCTSAARSLLGVAALMPGEVSQRELEELVARSWERGVTSEEWLWWMLERRRRSGRNGVGALEQAIAASAGLGITESWLERAYLRLSDRAGLERPVTQRRIERSGRFVARVDFWYEWARLVVEVLGYRHHRTREQLAVDLRRANELQLAGHRVLQYSHDHVVRSPSIIVEQVSAALRPAA